MTKPIAPHPTTQRKEVQRPQGAPYFAKTRPLSRNTANLLMEAGYTLLSAMQGEKPDVDLLRQAEAKVRLAFKTWRKTAHKGRQKNAGRLLESA
jgi:hypothetical protein